MTTSSFGPTMQEGALLKRMGSFGMAACRFRRVVGIVEAHRDEVADMGDARPQPRLSANQGKRLGLDLGEAREGLGAERIAAEIGDDVAEVVNAALAIDDSRLFLTRLSPPNEFHDVSPIPLTPCQKPRRGLADLAARRNNGESVSTAIAAAVGRALHACAGVEPILSSGVSRGCSETGAVRADRSPWRRAPGDIGKINDVLSGAFCGLDFIVYSELISAGVQSSKTAFAAPQA